MLLYLVKSIREIEIPASVDEELAELLRNIEDQLKEENIKKQRKRSKLR